MNILLISVLDKLDIYLIKDLIEEHKDNDKIVSFLYEYAYKRHCHACLCDDASQLKHMECENGCLAEEDIVIP